MNFGRFCLVLGLTICAAGVFGAVVGGLLGYAVPSSLNVIFGVSAQDLAKDKKLERAPEEGAGVKKEASASINVSPDKSIAAQGAAVGGAFGLILGVLAGAVLGVADQIVLLLRGGGRKPDKTA
ncbi:MAG: hypothetical protein NTW87_30545 [Planctomycetota bacterium]|nr:hypothetical protein [Planctomycetota bacterium]